MSKHRALRIEPLEDRRVLAASSFSLPPIPIAPGQIVSPLPGYAPILLPPGIKVQGATVTKGPIYGQLPSGLPDVAGYAEDFASGFIEAFTLLNRNTTIKATDKVAGGVFTLTITGKSGKNSFSYTVSEDKGVINVSFSATEGPASISLFAAENIKPEAAVLDLKVNAGKNQIAELKLSELNGNLTIVQPTTPITFGDGF